MRTWRRKALATIAILAYLAGTIGFPLPAPTIDAEQAEAAGVHRCGCPAEEQVQKSCCCSAEGGCCGEPAEDAPPVQWAGGVWTARCQGELPAWLVAAVVVLPSDLPNGCFESPCVMRLAPVDEHADRLSLPPTEPPPRCIPG